MHSTKKSGIVERFKFVLKVSCFFLWERAALCSFKQTIYWITAICCMSVMLSAWPTVHFMQTVLSETIQHVIHFINAFPGNQTNDLCLSYRASNFPVCGSWFETDICWTCMMSHFLWWLGHKCPYGNKTLQTPHSFGLPVSSSLETSAD